MAQKTPGEYLRRVKSSNTTPEVLVRKALWSKGLRYRIHHPSLPGRPDIVFTRSKIAIFVHGCYWHRHNCSRSFTPKSNAEFWRQKFQCNIQRDAKNTESLIQQGWNVVILWECEIHHDLDACIKKITSMMSLAKTPSMC